jgi:hypothetical protein
MVGRVVMRTMTDERTDGRTDDRTMAAGSSVTWMHCSVRYEVTWGLNTCIRADTRYVRTDWVRPHEHLASAWTHLFPPSSLLPSLPPPSLPPSPLPCGCNLLSAQKRTWTLEKKYFYFFLFFLFFGSCCRLEKRKKKFGFQSPRSPRSTGFAGEAARRRRFFGLVTLVTHPSSIPRRRMDNERHTIQN